MGDGGCKWNLSVVTFPPHVRKVMTSTEAAGKISLTSLVMSLALLGNCLVVVTVWRCRRLRTPTNVYIVSLAVSDLMVTLSCTWVHLVAPECTGVTGITHCTWFTQLHPGRLITFTWSYLNESVLTKLYLDHPTVSESPNHTLVYLVIPEFTWLHGSLST